MENLEKGQFPGELEQQQQLEPQVLQFNHPEQQRLQQPQQKLAPLEWNFKTSQAWWAKGAGKG